MLSIIRGLVNLRVIKLDGLWRSATEVNLVKLTRRCRRLEVLSIASCRGVTDKVLKAAALNCADLKVLDISCCRQVGCVCAVYCMCTWLFITPCMIFVTQSQLHSSIWG